MMKTPIKVAAILGIIGVVALVAVAGAVAATGSMPGISGTNQGNHMNGMMGDNGQISADRGAQCQSSNMANMMNGQGHVGMMNGNGQHCQGPNMQSQITQNADRTWDCPGYTDPQSST